MTDLHEEAERLAKAALGIEWKDTESAARRVAEYAAARLAEAERERDARVAAAYEEAGSLLDKKRIYGEDPKSGCCWARPVEGDDIRALARPEETDALERIKAEVWDEVAVLCNQSYGGSIGDIHKAAVMRAAAIREAKT